WPPERQAAPALGPSTARLEALSVPPCTLRVQSAAAVSSTTTWPVACPTVVVGCGVTSGSGVAVGCGAQTGWVVAAGCAGRPGCAVAWAVAAGCEGRLGCAVAAGCGTRPTAVAAGQTGWAVAAGCKGKSGCAVAVDFGAKSVGNGSGPSLTPSVRT